MSIEEDFQYNEKDIRRNKFQKKKNFKSEKRFELRVKNPYKRNRKDYFDED